MRVFALGASGAGLLVHGCASGRSL